jgi:adenylate cyclase
MLRVRFERERLYSNLASYLPEGAARKVAFAGPSAQVNAERHDATVMFVDLRNFSAYCENRSPEEAATVLHLFYTTIDRIVSQHGGVVEQMVGDSIMAVWNGSTPCADHAQKATGAAEEIWREGVAQLPKVASRKTPPLDLGLGIESGDVMIGSFGPAHRRVHTVLGDTVNTASRVCSTAAEDSIRVSSVANGLILPRLREYVDPLSAVHMKGKGLMEVFGIRADADVDCLPDSKVRQFTQSALRIVDNHNSS